MPVVLLFACGNGVGSFLRFVQAEGRLPQATALVEGYRFDPAPGAEVPSLQAEPPAAHPPQSGGDLEQATTCVVCAYTGGVWWVVSGSGLGAVLYRWCSARP